MCTNPIQFSRTYPLIGTKTYTVPCGKCAECRSKYQSEFAALSHLEAERCGSLSFYTLTYEDKKLPIAVSSFDLDGPHLVSFVRGSDSPVLFDSVEPVLVGDNFYCPSICREDLQKVLKRYRQDYFRRTGERLDLRFSAFGEYGEKFQRPHMHMLCYGLSREESYRLKEFWSFGFVGLEFVEHFNSDGSDAFAKVSRYVSKYVGKKDRLPQFVQDGYAEKPRKQTSIHLGVRDFDKEKYRNFTLPAIKADWSV